MRRALAIESPTDQGPHDSQSADIDQAASQRRGGLVAEAERNGWLIGSYNSKVFHRPDCSHVKMMAERNRRTFKTVTEAAAEGRVPCEYFESGQPTTRAIGPPS